MCAEVRLSNAQSTGLTMLLVDESSLYLRSLFVNVAHKGKSRNK